jgi:hypothetical protein
MPSLGRHFRNWISWAGIVLAAGALFSFLLLFAIDLFAARRSPYVGILAYVVAPAFFILGLLLTLVGALLEARKERKARRIAKPLTITIDLSRARDRRILAIFAAARPVIFRWSHSSLLFNTLRTQKWSAWLVTLDPARPRISRRKSTA